MLRTQDAAMYAIGERGMTALCEAICLDAVEVTDAQRVGMGDIADDRQVTIDMTLTAPGCPVAGEMPGWVENAVGAVPGVASVTVNMTFDPPWDQSRMSDEARVALDMW